MGRIRLDQRQVYVQNRIAQAQLAGLQHVEFNQYLDLELDEMVWQLRAYVLTSHGGEQVARTVRPEFVVEVPKRPWWIPKWVWNRLPMELHREHRRYTLVVTPLWTYPSANIKVPQLGRPVEFAVVDEDITRVHSRAELDWWKD